MKPNIPVKPLVDSERSKDLRDRDWALYVDGVRISAKPTITVAADGIAIGVNFATSRGAIDDPTVDPTIEIAWGGWKAGDSCHLRQPSKERLPTNGFAQIIRVDPPEKAGEDAQFTVKAITPLYDHIADQAICNAGEYARVPSSWFQR
jgi:hypothetical protein